MSASPDDLETIPFAHLAPSEQRDRLKDLALVFAKLGAIAFGGSAAHIAMIDDEVVQKRRWMSHSRLMDLLGVTLLVAIYHLPMEKLPRSAMVQFRFPSR